jgi:hypothetical protein
MLNLKKIDLNYFFKRNINFDKNTLFSNRMIKILKMIRETYILEKSKIKYIQVKNLQFEFIKSYIDNLENFLIISKIETKLGIRNIQFEYEAYNCLYEKIKLTFYNDEIGNSKLYSIYLKYKYGECINIDIQPNLDDFCKITEKQIYDSFLEIEEIINDTFINTQIVKKERDEIQEISDKKHKENLNNFLNRFNEDYKQ